MRKRVWIIGGSSGIGLELVKILLDKGHSLIVSSRSAYENDALLKLRSSFNNSLYLLNLDIKQTNLKEKVIEAWNVYKGLDIWFYNAGSYEVMDMDSWDEEKFIDMNSTNYLGVVKLMCQLSPFFSKQGYGKWVWNLSLSSIFGLPKGGGYSAPKAALLNLAQSIQPELKNKGIDLQIINHGFVKTRLTNKNSFDMPQLMTPQHAAQQIEKKMFSDSFEITFPFLITSFLKLLSFLPYKISLAITKKTL